MRPRSVGVIRDTGTTTPLLWTTSQAVPTSEAQGPDVELGGIPRVG